MKREVITYEFNECYNCPHFDRDETICGRADGPRGCIDNYEDEIHPDCPLPDVEDEQKDPVWLQENPYVYG